jgi:hypothetical protein
VVISKLIQGAEPEKLPTTTPARPAPTGRQTHASTDIGAVSKGLDILYLSFSPKVMPSAAAGTIIADASISTAHKRQNSLFILFLL